jgi:hypothetical protein
MKHPVNEVIQRWQREILIKNDMEDEMLFLAMIGLIRELADEHVTFHYRMTRSAMRKHFNFHAI